MAKSPQTFDAWLIERLAAAGVYSAAADGGHGRGVIAALKTFQADLGLPVTGKADSATVAALRSSPHDPVVPPPEPVWLREARRFMGLKEIAGPASNATIMGWARALGGWIASYYSNDDIPWCGLFLAHIMGATLPKELLPSNPLSAKAWGAFGRKLTVPALGAVMVFTREGGGHVGLYLGETATAYRILGGNQSNSVSITWIAKTRLYAIRWPSTVTAPVVGGRIHLAADGSPLSTNEA
ncbi:TIGR02594 family protein [Pleomorphomonas carboxyditropha]|uniref:TIGR02594 family protein n=1 Tax=Pleomorphomonas carboxyditropha TaxID=2023338 RepID=A0A2G9WV94_9HYPH|nr:TIGR02594 family protein [Pleomorphomonas carboxyditropha]PIO98599.1 TIGR02594 family protein [Pleomorphomonas carboxyditropha]